MSVYIDNFNAPYRNMTMCHMWADTRQELTDMCKAVGLSLHWIQRKGTPEEHYDISAAKKKQALAAGAVEVNMRDYAKAMRQRKEDINWYHKYMGNNGN